MLNLLSFELHLQVRQLAFGISSIAYFVFSILLGNRIFGGENEVINSEYSIAFHLGLLSLTLVFPIMFFTVRASLRDQQFRFSEIIFSTPLSRSQYFSSRYLGVLLSTLMVLALIIIGFALGITFADVSYHRKLGFQFLPYFRVFWYLLLPNTIILSVLLFSLSSWTKSSTATYLGATFIYAAYWLCAIFLNSPLLAQAVAASPENMVLAALFDPFGLSAFFEQTQLWTIAEKNQKPLSFSGLLLWNRLIWLALAFLSVQLTYRYYSWKSIKAPAPKQLHEIPVSVSILGQQYWVETRTASFYFHWSTFVSLTKQHLRFFFSNLPFLISIIALTGICLIEMYTYVLGGDEYHQHLLPTTAILIERIVDPLQIFGLLLLLFYTSELLGRSKQYHFASLLDSSPIGLYSQYFAYFVSLSAIPIMLISLSIICGIGFQLALDFSQIRLDFWLGIYYYQGGQLLLYLLFTLLIHLLVKNKYIGLLLSTILLLLLSSSLGQILGIHHPMLQLARLPQVLPTDMTAYGYTAYSFHHYICYWGLLLVLFTMVAISFWKYPRTKLPYSASLFCGILFLLAATKVFYHNNVEVAYQSPAQLLDQQEDYEKRYKQFENLPRLSYHSLNSQVNLYPSERSVAIEANYILINQQQAPIHQLLVSAREALDTLFIEGARLLAFNEVHQTYHYHFEQAIIPGQKIKLHYKTHIQHGAFNDSKQLASSGSFLLNTTYEPVLFYRKSQEISSSNERKKRGLPPLPEESIAEQFHHHSPGLPRVHFEATLSVPTGHDALAPGQLVRNWTSADRNYYQYKSAATILPMIAFIAGKYKNISEKHQGIEITHYYHAEHDYNIDSIQQYIRATLDYCTHHFGPYPYDYLRMAELPAYWNFGGHAQAGLITMVADRLYLKDLSDTSAFNVTAKRTIHEVAHQWWGHVLAPKNIAGAALIIEGLAKYTEAMVMQQLYGPGSRAAIEAEALDRYLEGSAFEQEPESPLYLQDGQNYLAYGKSCLALLAVEEVIGEQQMNAALRQLIEQFGHQNIPSMTSLDLVESLRCYVPEEQHALLTAWFMHSGLPKKPMEK